MEILKDKLVYSNSVLNLSKTAMEAILNRLNKHSIFICYDCIRGYKEGEIIGQTKEDTAYIINDEIYADIMIEENFIDNYNYDFVIIQELDDLEEIKIAAIYTKQ